MPRKRRTRNQIAKDKLKYEQLLARKLEEKQQFLCNLQSNSTLPSRAAIAEREWREAHGLDFDLTFKRRKKRKR